ncbi:hypothetical protein NXX73_00125 [Bacteroides fragilis]|nr:hypothetical protein [Bacteroides fragilis]
MDLKRTDFTLRADIDAGHYYTLSGVVPNAGDIKFVPQRDIEYISKKSQMKIVLFLAKMYPICHIWRKFESAIYKGFEFSMFGQGIRVETSSI